MNGIDIGVKVQIIQPQKGSRACRAFQQHHTDMMGMTGEVMLIHEDSNVVDVWLYKIGREVCISCGCLKVISGLDDKLAAKADYARVKT